ncbi:alpha/beta hydrolase fold domain-containing protein [Micromonospora kangleipakensis]|uniref:alpha/beta hydrolase fold domain-containing protein n=1 Tax=Micromonospora kangleipakensis TaxID=1077942 RepID=UPI00102A41BD
MPTAETTASTAIAETKTISGRCQCAARCSAVVIPVDAGEPTPGPRPTLSPGSDRWSERCLLPGEEAEPRIDLLSLPAQDLSGLPSTLVMTTDRDVLQSQGGEWCTRLQAACVPATRGPKIIG